MNIFNRVALKRRMICLWQFSITSLFSLAWLRLAVGTKMNFNTTSGNVQAIGRNPWILKDSLVEWFGERDPQIAFTGTAKQSVGYLDAFDYQKLTISKLEFNVRNVMKKASRKVYGCNLVKRGFRLQYLGTIEGHKNNPNIPKNRLHVHLAIEYDPKHSRLSKEEIQKVIKECWCASFWGYDEAKPKYASDDRGWNEYMLKKFDPYDEDWMDRVLMNSKRNPPL